MDGKDSFGFISLDRRPLFRSGNESNRIFFLESVFCDFLRLYDGMSDRDCVAIFIDLLGRKVHVLGAPRV